MTMSWGGPGVWWERNAATVYILRNRFTKEFIDAGERFTIAALPESCRKAMVYMGAHSDRDGVAVPAEAEAGLVRRKLFAVELPEETFIEPDMKEQWYFGGDEGNYHTMYIAEIEKVFVKE